MGCPTVAQFEGAFYGNGLNTFCAVVRLGFSSRPGSVGFNAVACGNAADIALQHHRNALWHIFEGIIAFEPILMIYFQEFGAFVDPNALAIVQNEVVHNFCMSVLSVPMAFVIRLGRFGFAIAVDLPWLPVLI